MGHYKVSRRYPEVVRVVPVCVGEVDVLGAWLDRRERARLGLAVALGERVPRVEQRFACVVESVGRANVCTAQSTVEDDVDRAGRVLADGLAHYAAVSRDDAGFLTELERRLRTERHLRKRRVRPFRVKYAARAELVTDIVEPEFTHPFAGQSERNLGSAYSRMSTENASCTPRSLAVGFVLQALKARLCAVSREPGGLIHPTAVCCFTVSRAAWNSLKMFKMF